jgi:hypothetical protein
MVSEPYVRSQTWGGIATSTFQIYALHYRVVIPIFAILLLPFWMLWDLVLPTATMGQALLLLTINSILQILGTGVLTVAIHDICMGNEPSIRHSFTIASRRLSQLVKVSILQSVFIILGVLMLIVPGIIISIRYLFSASAVIVEGLSPGEALKRSAQLGKGRWWKCGIIYGGFFLVYITPALALPMFLQDETTTILQSLISNLPALLYPLPQISAVLMYYDLRSRKENLDIRPLFVDIEP